MGTKSDYVAGTITVTQGSVDFTGTDTLWRVMGFQEGDTVLLKGYQMVIDAGNVGSGLETQLITSNTSGKFTEAWPGETGTFEYRMRYQSNDSRLSAKVSNLLLQMASGNLSSISELETIEGDLIRATGAGTFEAIAGGIVNEILDLTPTAKSMLYLDANADVQQLAFEASKIIGSNDQSLPINIDTSVVGLLLLKLAGTAAANKMPFLDTNNSAALTDLTAAARVLLGFNGTAGNIPVMTGANAYASRPIVGTVSQSGGVPTGALVEYGGTAIQGYVRFAGGLQICWADTSNIPISNAAVGNIFRGDTTSMGATPAAFAAVPMVIVGGTGSAGGGWTAQEVYQTSNNWGSFSVRSATSVGTTARYFLVAIGRWY